MQVGGIGNEGRNGNSGLDNRGVSHQSINYRIDDSAQDARKQDTARRDVAEKTTSAYTVSFSSEGKRLAAEYAEKEDPPEYQYLYISVSFRSALHL